MTVYELIQELSSYDANNEVKVEFNNDNIDFICGGCEQERTISLPPITTDKIVRTYRTKQSVVILEVDE